LAYPRTASRRTPKTGPRRWLRRPGRWVRAATLRLLHLCHLALQQATSTGAGPTQAPAGMDFFLLQAELKHAHALHSSALCYHAAQATPSPTCTTRARRSPRRTGPSARRSSTCLTRSGAWPTTAASTRARRATGSPSRVRVLPDGTVLWPAETLLVACRLCVAGLCPHAQQCCHTHTYSHHGRKLRAEVQLPYTLMLLG